jgi:hypothetical protein
MRYIIDYKNISIESINSNLASFNATIVKTFQSFPNTYLVDVNVAPNIDNALHNFIEPDQSISVTFLENTVVFDPNYMVDDLTGQVCTIDFNAEKDWWKLYSLFDPNFNATSATIDRHGTGRTIYLLDSGIKISHPEFLNRPVTNLFSFNGNFDDNLGHGTMVASVIAGVTTGISNANVKSVKVADVDANPLISDLLSCLDAVQQDYTNLQLDFAVVNCSWSIEKNLLIESKITNLVNNGFVFIVAADSVYKDITTISPQGMENVITVAAYDENFECLEPLVENIKIDGFGPGVNINVATLDDQTNYRNGTSIAAGIASAAMTYNVDSLGIDLIRSNLNFDPIRAFWRVTFQKHNIITGLDFALVYNRGVGILNTKTQSSWFNSAVVGQEGTKFWLKYVNQPSDLLSITFLENLPGDFELTNKGVLKGTFPMVEETTIYTIPMIVNRKDGTSENVDLLITSVAANFNPQMQSTGNSEIDTILLSPQNYGCGVCTTCTENCDATCNVYGVFGCTKGTQWCGC